MGNPLKPLRDWDRGLKLFSVNEEFPVSASHKLALTTSLPFVHTARRYYRLNDLVRSSDWDRCSFRAALVFRKDAQTESFRGSKSRNKVSVGEPAEGSLTFAFFFLFGELKICRQANEGTPWVELCAIKDVTSGDAGSAGS